MGINNKTKARISFLHKERIQSLFNKHIKGMFHIDHFSLNIFFGNSHSVFLSPTPKMAEELCKHNFVDHDSNYSPDIYEALPIYPWRSVQRTQEDQTINFIKEEKFGMRSGMMIVRNLGSGRYAMYSFATHKRDSADFPGQFNFLFHNKANQIAEVGDFMYESLLPIINEYTEQEGIYMPGINAAIPLMPSPIVSEQFEDVMRGRPQIPPKGTRETLHPYLRVIDGCSRSK